MALNMTQKQALWKLQKYLDVQHPNFSGSDHIRAHLGDEGVQIYLQTWVLPLIQALKDDVPANSLQRII